MTIIYPDYNNSILNLSNSILKHYGITPQYPTLNKLDEALALGFKNVVLIIYDGLGKNILQNHLNANAFLNRKTEQTITSVFPPTTAAATTSIYSATPPIAHGWLGWSLYFKNRKQVIELFTGKDFYTQQKTDLNGWEEIPYEQITQKIKAATNGAVKTHKVFKDFGSGNGVHSVDEQCARIYDICQNTERNFILSYWTEPDHTMHLTGPDTPQVTKIITDINQKIENLCTHLSDTLVIITADHGQIKAREQILINNYPEMLECLQYPLHIEDRAANVFLKPGTADKFKTEFNKHLAQDFILLSKEEILKTKLFGPEPVSEKAKAAIGDYIIIGTTYKTITQHVENMTQQFDLIGVHAGLTPDEMLVPMIIIKSKDRTKKI